MSYMDKSIEELHELLKNGNVTSRELIEESLKKSHEVQEKYNAFVTILDDAKEVEITDEYLSGIPYGIKDNYSTKGILSTGSSNTLKDYVPFFDATSIENLARHGAVPVNKTVMDEFGMGGTGTTGHTGIVKNPWDPSRMCAGSSAGSACAVAAGVYPYATGSDTGDSIRKPAAYCGIVGYIGKEKALPRVLSGLKFLEYRGYDSAGVAFVKDNNVNVIKEVGKIKALESLINYEEETYMGIGHTRWATHGIPSVVNSHPHRVGKFTVVHNGIIENYLKIKEMLINEGIVFVSDTDTEVIPALLQYNYENAFQTNRQKECRLQQQAVLQRLP